MLFTAWPVWALEAVTLQLKWDHAFQFAGYYAAQELGYYRDAGLEVQIRSADAHTHPVEEVLAGRAQYGVGTSSLLLERQAGKPVVVLAVIFQHSPQVLLARQVHSQQSVHDLAGKTVMLEPQSEELIAYLNHEKVPIDTLRRLPHSHKIEDLINGRVDALSAYATYEPFFMKQSGVDYQVYTPRSVGIDFYGDNLFTSEQELQANPQRVAAFRRASLRGWQYAMAHPEHVIDWILNRYPSPRLTREFLRFEAERMAELLRTDLVDIGYMTTGRWQHIAETYARVAVARYPNVPAGFLYEHDVRQDFTWLYRVLFVVATVLLVVMVIALYIHRVNRRLANAVADKTRSEERYRVIFQTSPSAGMVWRDGFVVTDWNSEAEAVFGWKREEVVGRPFTEFLLPIDQRERLSVRFSRMVQQNVLPSGINDNLTRDGRTITCEWFNAWLPHRPGQPIEVVSLAHDITERQRLQHEVRELAFYDALTKLPNRRLLQERLDQMLSVIQQQGTCAALMFLDLDNFKPLNDSHGHKMGDILLMEVACRLAGCARQTDTVARFGGDEFVVLIGPLDVVSAVAREQALALAQGIRDRLSDPYELAGADGIQPLEHRCTASVGVVVFKADTDAEKAMQLADSAMYQAKEAGRNQVFLADACPRPACEAVKL
ncbi:MAG: hypothetical protein RLZZ352_1003 [Pseudomonadota bacterium]|jgi:diguanylate cyclase (GGDEF)-like protein/PAS domain S-box-containing protein